MTNSLLPTRFLFNFSVPCFYREQLWTTKGAQLDEKYRLPYLGDLDQRPQWSEIRAAWNESGLAFSVCVSGKKQAVWCRASRPEDSDGLRIWLNTRDVHNIHRANRFCHQFTFLPSGNGRNFDQPYAELTPVNRAKENPQAINAGILKATCISHRDGYKMDVLIPAEALTGFDPIEHPRLGFTYAVIDREFGEQTLGVSSPFPYREDPSLWSTLELKR